MTEISFCVLMAIMKGVRGDYVEISDISGYALSSVHTATPALLEHGCIHKPCHGKFQITERGKIALAIEVGKRSRARADKRSKQRMDRIRQELLAS